MSMSRRFKIEELTERILAVLNSNKERFVCGIGIKRRSGFLALRMAFSSVSPLFAPSLSFTSCTQDSNSHPRGKSPAKLSTLQSKSSTPFPHIYGACRKGASSWPSAQQFVKKFNNRVQNGRSNSCRSRSKSGAASTISSVSGCSFGSSTAKWKPTIVRPGKRASKFARSAPTSDCSDLDTYTIESLESIIPIPASFDGENNPFLDVQSSKSLKTKKRKRGRKFLSNDKKAIKKELLTPPPSDGSVTPSLSSQNSPVKYFFRRMNQAKRKKDFNVLARRTTANGKVEYLLEWANDGSQK